MPISAGKRLGSYEVVAQIGAGGMGEVYKAHDTKLGPDVAIKILPEAFAHDSERLARFQREARMLAALNHPNIATIHGLEHSDGTHFLIMELMPGETLAERMHPETWDLFFGIAGEGHIAYQSERQHGVASLKPRSFCAMPPGYQHEVRNLSASEPLTFLLIHAPWDGYQFVQTGAKIGCGAPCRASSSGGWNEQPPGDGMRVANTPSAEKKSAFRK